MVDSQKVKEVVARHSVIPIGKMEGDDCLYQELKMDALDVNEMVTDIEETFNIKIDRETENGFIELDDVITHVIKATQNN